MSVIGNAFTDNTATNGDGGAISWSSNAVRNDLASLFSDGLSIVGLNMFSSNTAGNSGGAVSFNGYLESEPVSTDTRRAVYLESNSFINNSALNGGAVYFNLAGYIAFDGLTAIGNNISFNSATGDGGAIYTGALGSRFFSRLNLYNSNTAGGSGGAVYAAENREVISELADNYVGNNANKGGAVYITGEAVKTISFNTITMRENTANYGGALAIEDINDVDQYGMLSFLKLGSTTFSDNVASFQGGAVWINNVTFYNDINWNMTIDHSQFLRNTANEGGALYVIDARMLFWNFPRPRLDITNSTFSSNSSVSNGGAISINSNIPLFINSVGFEGNTASSYSSIIQGNGGSIYASGLTSLRIISSSFSSLTASSITSDATNGGALYLDNVVTTILTNDFFQGLHVGNADILSRGGAIYATGAGFLRLTGCTLYNNFAENGGGALYAVDLTTLMVDGSSFVSNYSNEMGGAINVVTSGTVTVIETTFQGNTSPNNGGAIYSSNNQSLSITTSVFKLNRSNSMGGAIYTEDGGTATFTSNTFGDLNGNDALSGGALYIMHETAVLNGNTFQHNNADQGGGAISFIGSASTSMTITGDTFIENAALRGGAIEAIGALAILDNCFDDNLAFLGGALYITSSSPSIINMNFFDGNNAMLGSAIYGVIIQNMSITNNIFMNNQSTYNGAVYTTYAPSATGTLTMTGNTYLNNYDPLVGGIISAQSNTPSASDASLITAVSSSMSGSILYVNKNATGSVHDGSSWATAFLTLDQALTAAAATFGPDQIWVTKGTYIPGGTSFLIPNGVVLFGGFVGNETSLSQHNSNNMTTLGGSVFMNGVAAIMDGFSMTGTNGAAISLSNNANLLLYNSSFSHITSPTAVINSTVSSLLTVMNSTFTQNIGGAINATANNLLVVGYSTFNGNSANSGGAINSNGFTGINLVANSYINNTASSSNGGAIAITNNVGSLTVVGPACCGTITLPSTMGTTSITGSTFVNNQTVGTNGNGGAIYICGVQSVTISGDSFTNTRAAGSGGAIFVGGSMTNGNVLIQNDTFTNNRANVDGGAVATSLTGTGTISLLGNAFTNNNATGKGGAYRDNSSMGVSLVIKTNTFQNNTAAQGKAIWLGDNETALNNLCNTVPGAGTTADDTAWINNLIANNSNLLANQIYIL